MSASNQVGAFNYAVPPFTKLQIKNITAAYTVVANDNGTIINCTSGTFTVSLTAAATLGSGFNCYIWNTGSGVVTIDPSGAETLDGKSTRVLPQGQGTQIVCTGSLFISGAPKQYFLYEEKYDPTISIRPTVTATQGGTALGYGSSTAGNVGLSGGYVASAGGEGALALGYRATATSGLSTAIGQNSAYQGSQAVTGVAAMALGGSYASGTDSFAAAVADNTSTYGARGNNSISMGQFSTSSSASSVAIGVFATASGNQSYAFGRRAEATGTAALALGSGFDGVITASGAYSIAIGNCAQAVTIGKYALSVGRFAANGDAQAGTFILRRATTDATATVLTTDNSAPGATNQVILPNNSAYTVTGTVICRQSVAGSDKASGWTFTAVIRRGANAASTALVAAVTPILVAQDLSLATTVLAITADTTNGGLAVTVTGIAATNLRWVATIQTSECTYA